MCPRVPTLGDVDSCNLITNNCLNATYDAIHGHGTGSLPNPNIWRASNLYFDHFNGRHEWLLHR